MHHSHYLIAGLGKTGLSIARYLQRRKQSFSLFDTRASAPQASQFMEEFPGVDIYLGEFPQSIISQLTAIIASPGVELTHAGITQAKAQGVSVYGDVECFAREVAAPVIAITGTNGKSTVTTLVGEMAKAAGLNVAVAGNIGAPVLDLLDSGVAFDLWVLELSSFQLDLIESLTPLVATILNITEDHLDRHASFLHYQAAKQRIYHHAASVVFNRDDPATRPALINDTIKNKSSLLKQWFAIKTPELEGIPVINFGLDKPALGHWGIEFVDDNAYLMHGEQVILSVDALRIKGQHNWSNALAACALATQAGIDSAIIVDVLRNFSGLKHRSEWVRRLNGVDWINDSKGTNVGATRSAISGIGASLEGKIVLIAGGQGKGADFSALRDPVHDYVRCVVLIGEDADKLQRSLKDIVLILRAESLEEAVNLAHHVATPGDVVLLSPACASLDMFTDFNHRGTVFVSAVESL